MADLLDVAGVVDLLDMGRAALVYVSNLLKAAGHGESKLTKFLNEAVGVIDYTVSQYHVAVNKATDITTKTWNDWSGAVKNAFSNLFKKKKSF